MECPYCGEELVHWDSFGRVAAHQDGKIFGNIYKCPNEECDSDIFNRYFYERIYPVQEGLKEGYPV